MAKEFTLKGIIKFLDQGATATIKKVDQQVATLRKNTEKISGGFRDFNQGLAVVGTVGTAAGLGFGAAIAQAANFEQAMADLNAVNELTDNQMQRLTNTALQLGAKTAFSSTEAAQAMTELTKAGLTVEQTIDAIPGVLSAAAAEGMGLAQAGEIVVGILQGQNLAMDQSSRVADVLAKTANATASGITDLGEAFKFSNILATQGILSFEETAAALGLMSNAGLKGSIAGTSLVNMFNQLAKPSRKVESTFAALGLGAADFTDETGKWLSIPQIVAKIGKVTDGLATDQERLAFLSDLVGVEGAKAFSTLRRAVTSTDSQGRPMFQGLKQDLDNASGAAEEMASKRLNSLKGALTIIGSALQNIGIFIGNIFVPHLRAAGEFVKQFAGDMAAAFMFIGQTGDAQAETAKTMSENAKMMVGFVQGFQEGISEAISTIKTVLLELGETFKGILPPGEDGLRMAGKWIAKAAVLAAAIAPLAIGFIGISFAIGSVISGFSGLISIGSGTFGIIKQLISLVFTADKAILKFVGSLIMKVPAALGVIKLAFIKLGAVMLANPIGASIAVIGALVAAGWLLFKNWDSVTSLLKSAWQGVVETFQSFVAWISNASIGEIIVKTLLFPVRAALEPIMQMVKFLASSSIGKSLLGEGTAGMIESATRAMSLFGGTETPLVEQRDQTAQMAARDTMAGRVEAKRLNMPASAQPEVNVNVPAPVVELTNETVTMVDGEVIDKKMTKRRMERTERAGMNAVNPKNRQLAKQGDFAAGFSR